MSLTPRTDLTEDTEGVIYMAISPSGNKYIGKTVRSLSHRKMHHHYDAKYGAQTPLHKAIRKYGNDMKWVILDSYDTDEELQNAEKLYIEKYDTYNNGYNCTLGGDGHAGFKQSEETIRRRAEKVSKSLTGRKLSEEHIKLLSKSHKGQKAWNKGKNYGERTRKKISEAQDHRKRTVLCIETAQIFSSITEASRELNIDKGNLQKHLSNNPKYKSYKTVKGFTFKFVENK